MAKQFDTLEPGHQSFIAEQKIFFVATAGQEGLVNVSPKGMESFQVVNERCVRWLNVTGSGNETAAHVLENRRMTIMFCAFEGKPIILRLYGMARAVHPRDAEWSQWVSAFPALPAARQIFELDINMVQTSCGMGVPFFDYRDERDQLKHWAEKKGTAGVVQYWSDKNSRSLDGKPTGT
ncbi:MAG: pyridoxamine 5'-phosphate oxidase family protein [Gammaproteobacteria bacterium]|nr:pyridoxamine 5'-phosphate oxidase family protein [Gammaproteobacteria bacterium]